MANIEGLVLAAGLSSRMGTNKLLLEVNGSAIIEKTVAILLGTAVSGVSIVLGSCSNEIRRLLDKYPINFIYNSNYKSGMSYSIKSGIDAMMERIDIDAVLIMLGDMPLIDSSTVNRLIEEYENNCSLIIVPRYNGRSGHPVLFSREMFESILEIKGDNGAREVVNKFLDQVLFVDVDDSGIIIDLDTKEDLERNFYL